jgi:hypothetical protein
LGYNYRGLKGYSSTYRVISNARQVGTRFNVTNAVQQDIQAASVPLFQFAIFYNSLLEFTTAGAVLKPLPWAGATSYGGTIAYNGGNPVTNYTTLALPIGTNNTAAAVREVLYPPPAGESVSSDMGVSRYYNKAQINIVVSNTTAMLWVKTGASDTASNVVPWTNFSSFVNTNVSFTDQRESKTVQTTQIDVGKMLQWMTTNTTLAGKVSTPTNKPITVYVADFRTMSSSTMTGVRLTNGATLPGGGLTFATMNPLYVLGHFNCPNAAYLGTTNTSQSAPASLLGDAITVLSPSWSDSSSSSSYTTRQAVNTTINAAIVAGNVVSTGSGRSQFSGGVHNLTRLLEDWGSGADVLTLNTSIINLFNSVIASNKFIYPGDPGCYYTAPARNFSYDVNFNDPAKQPPGTPMLRAMIRTSWVNAPANTTNYAGY